MQDPGFKKLTMEDVAKELGVSKTTVSRSLSGKGRIGKETRQRVLDYIAQYNEKSAGGTSEHASGHDTAEHIPAGNSEADVSDIKEKTSDKGVPKEHASGRDLTAEKKDGKTASAADEHVPDKQMTGTSAASKKSTSKRRQPKSGTGNIGVVLPADLFDSDRPYFPKALKGISEVADSEEYDVFMILVDPNDLSRLSRVIGKRKADGLILIRTLQDDKTMEMLKNSSIPFAAVGVSEDSEIYQADNDYAEACFELTSILLMKGLKKIAAVAGNMDYMINQKRMQGFYKAHQAHKVTPDRSLIFTDVSSSLAAARAADTAVMRGAGCIICADDLLASQVLRELEEKHVRIPEEIKLASFHDSQLLASAKTGITAIQFHTEELGREACRMLLHQIRGEEVPHMSKLSYEVTLRESTK